MPAPSSRRAGAFAIVLRRQREAAGLTQAELAERAGLGVRTVSNLERGINPSPYPNTVRLLADALEVPEQVRRELVTAARRRGAASDPGAPRTGGYLGAVPTSRLVARDDERARIAGVLDAVDDGAGRTVLLVGEPGIGKTRLAQEASVLAAERGFLIASGRCYAPQRETPFAPLFDVFSALYQAAPSSASDSIAERRSELATLLPDHFRDLTPQRRPDQDAGLRLLRAAAGFVREIADSRAVAVLVDDLQWADAATVEMLTHLAHQTPTSRVLLLGTYREAEIRPAHPVHTFMHSLHREGRSEMIPVRRLDRGATARLITDRLGDAPVSDDLISLLHTQSDGNPFFLVEILTAFAERGDLEQVDGQWVRRDAAELPALVNVSDAIYERVSRLSEPAQGLLDSVSVLGEVFDVEDLSIVDLSDDAVETALDEAVASGLLTTVGDRYSFDHSLTQQSLYRGLPPTRRRRLHRRVGESLERRPVAVRRRRAMEIARHLETGGVPDRAVRYFLLAGDVAAELHSQGEALRFYRHGLELAEEVGDEAATAAGLERLGQIELATASYDEALDHLVRASAAYVLIGDVEGRLRTEGEIASVQHRRGEGDAAAVRLAEVVTELEARIGPDGRAPGVAALCNGLARVRLSLGQRERAAQAAERAADLARDEDSVAVEADAHAILGTVLLFLDRPDDAVDALERAITLAKRIELDTVVSGATLGLQWTLTMRGELEHALIAGERGLSAARRSGDTDAEALHAANIGLTHFYLGQWEEAQDHLVRSVALAETGSPTLFSGIPPAYLGLLRFGQGDLAAATACYDNAATAPDLQTFEFDAYLDARRAEVELNSGDPSTALTRVEKWLDGQASTRLHDVMVLSIGAEVCLALGDLERAEDLVARARQRAAATKNEIDGIDAQRLDARCLAVRGRSVQARRCLDEALARAEVLPHPAAAARVRRELDRLVDPAAR